MDVERERLTRMDGQQKMLQMYRRWEISISWGIWQNSTSIRCLHRFKRRIALRKKIDWSHIIGCPKPNQEQQAERISTTQRTSLMYQMARVVQRQKPTYGRAKLGRVIWKRGQKGRA